MSEPPVGNFGFARNRLLFCLHFRKPGALAGEMVVQLGLSGDCVVREQRLLRHQLGRIRDVRIDSSGKLYLLTDGGEGMLYRVELPHSEIMQGSGPY